MKIINVIEELELTGTDMILEKGDNFVIKEGNPRVGTEISTREMESISLFDFRDTIVNKLEAMAHRVDNLSIMTDYFSDQPEEGDKYRRMLIEVVNAVTAAELRVYKAAERF